VAAGDGNAMKSDSLSGVEERALHHSGFCGWIFSFLGGLVGGCSYNQCCQLDTCP